MKPNAHRLLRHMIVDPVHIPVIRSNFIDRDFDDFGPGALTGEGLDHVYADPFQFEDRRLLHEGAML